MASRSQTSAAQFYSFFHEFVRGSSSVSRAHGRVAGSRARGVQARPFHHHTARYAQKDGLRPQSHYDIFPATLPAGPPPSGPFAINVRDLRKEFLQLQAKAHPDLHSGNDKRRAEGMSMLINEAYKTLQNPLLRAQYLLSLRGIDVAEDETMKIEDPELLMEVLDMRETIEAAEEESELDPLKATNDQKIEESVQVLDKAFKNDDMDTAKAEAVRLRYWVNIAESLHGWEKGKPIVLHH
jgi:molecular chaperone HscB